jgi:hypothetical protein
MEQQPFTVSFTLDPDSPDFDQAFDLVRQARRLGLAPSIGFEGDGVAASIAFQADDE